MTINQAVQRSTIQVLVDAVNTMAQVRFDRESYRDPLFTRIDALRSSASDCGFTCIAAEGACEIWERSGLRLNLWVQGIDSQEIADGGLGFDTNTDWYEVD